jgi:hypothetical protein
VKYLKEHSAFIVVFVLCAVLRFLPLFNYQFTYDELSGLERTQFNSFGELIEKGVKVDAHPAFVQVLIFYLVKIFGYSTWIIKLPFLLFSFGALIYGYALGLRNFSKHVGLVLCIFLAFSLVFVFYAPIARMYISGIFFSLALLYYFFELIFNGNTTLKNYFLFGLFAWLSALNQHMNSLFAATVYLSGFFFLQKGGLKHYVFTGAVIVIAYLPHLGVSLYQLGIGGIGRDQGGWLEKPSPDALLGFIKIILGTGSCYVFVITFAIAAAIKTRQAPFSKQQLFLLSVFLFNYFVIFLYSVYRAAIYQHSMMLFAGMAFLVFVASLLDFRDKVFSGVILTLLFAMLMYKSYYKKNYLGQSVKTVFEYQFERTAHYKKKYGNEAVYPVFFDADAIMKRIYFGKYGKFNCTISSDPALASMKTFAQLIAGLKCDYLVVTSATPAQQAVARQYFPYLLENTQTQGVNFKLYSKRPDNKTLEVPDDDVITFSSPVWPGGFVYRRQIDKGGLLINSNDEYPYDANVDFHTVVKEEGNMVLLTIRLKQATPDSCRIEACINVSDPASGEAYGYAARSASDFIADSDSTVKIYTDYYVGTVYPKIKKSARLGCYLWNRAHQASSLQFFQVTVIDYWHNKWHFWD